jgi:hypothetical protein
MASPWKDHPLLPPVLAVVLVSLTGLTVRAQGTSGPVVSDSKVGYIDSALLGNLFRFRFDATYNNRRPNRADFFYAPSPPFGPGLPVPERSLDYQDLTAYLETAWTDRFSTFVELPVRFLNPDLNANTAGFADLNAGFKGVLFQSDASVLTFQLRTYAPSGNVGRGLGTGHVSLEPALLAYSSLTDRLHLEGELRNWVPLTNNDFAGDVLRYGIGLGYDLFGHEGRRITPVAELVGWTVLGGKESVVPPSGPALVQGAGGDTILNAKLGMRVELGHRGDFYAGYGRPLTGDRWYENVFRLELRLFY